MVEKADWLPVIEDECSRHPRMGPHDLQKLVYQATFGGDHLLADAARFVQSLTDEWDQLVCGDESRFKPPLQLIDPSRKTARIHLAVCKARGVSPGDLAGRLARQPLRLGTRSCFERSWGDLLRLAREGRIGFDPHGLAALSFPHHLPHHSPDYGPAAYRLVHDVHDPETRQWLEAWGLLS